MVNYEEMEDSVFEYNQNSQIPNTDVPNSQIPEKQYERVKSKMSKFGKNLCERSNFKRVKVEKQHFTNSKNRYSEELNSKAASIK